MLRRTSYQRRYRKQRGEHSSAETTCCAGAQSNDSSASALPLPPSKARGVAPTRWRNDGTWGEGRKTCSLHCESEPPRPARRARTSHSHTCTRARRTCRPTRRACSGREAVAEPAAFFYRFPEKFLERRRPREAGGWGAQGSRRLRESETSKTHRHRPASIHHAMAKESPRPPRPSRRGGKHGDCKQPLLPLPVPSPEALDHGEKGEGRGSDENLKRSLEVCVE